METTSDHSWLQWLRSRVASHGAALVAGCGVAALRRVVLMAGAGGANCCQFYIVDVTNIWENFSLEFVKLPP